ncbi:condensin complex subunit 3 isoform X2 [Morus notabilis]|uniref:condensin complex subunit 3 isoform X2 n=1 Tax=Morus notabilis TaxID=981085 RepID=UPI000CECF901|nr:condensin complex subunit 3 isoform X2 [Morus notabilis]
MAEEIADEDAQLASRIAKILDEASASIATHNRKLKELSALRSKTTSSSSSSSSSFFSAFAKALLPLFDFQRRLASAERVVRFVSAFATYRGPNQAPDCGDAFLEDFLRFLLAAAAAANRTARFRACHIFSEIIMRLPDDAEVTNELWDDVIECLKILVEDKVPVIRTCAVRALSRFATDCEDSDVLDLFLEVLPSEPNAEVRKTILLSLPPSNATSQAIIDCTMDVSESVRKAAYYVLADKFPLQSHSIKLRTVILQRGLADRSAVVSKECLKLMKDKWLTKCCNGDPIEFLKYIDVETYELVGESVMRALLEAGLIQIRDGQSIGRYILSECETTEDTANATPNIQLMEAEDALYWRMVCWHLQKEAQAKGSDAAAAMGTEAAVYAEEASKNNDLLERILPATVSDYIQLVKAHMNAGLNFPSRQLVLLGAMLDFSDTTNRKVASEFLVELLHKPFDHEVDDDGNMVVLGDGINLGGDGDWAEAVSGLARKVYAASGEFEEVILRVIEELAQPCRERTANFMQWMHCLAVIGLLLENARSLRSIQGKVIEPTELLQSLLLPAAKHAHLDVQRITVRCLGLFGLLEKKPSKEVVKQLRLSFIRGPTPISVMACKALIDLGMWHNPQEVDGSLGLEVQDSEVASSPITLSDEEENPSTKLLDLLYAALDKDDLGNLLGSDGNESVQAVLGEGFAKILLLSENYLSIPASLHPLLLTKLINLYFSSKTKDLHRLKQFLSVFFEHYPSLSAKHKKYISKAFVPVMRSMWPGIDGNAGGSAFVVSNMRKRAVQASRFMLHMMQAPPYRKENETEDVSGSEDLPETENNTVEPPPECGEEGLAIRIAAEVASFPEKKTPAERAYISAMCRVLVLLHFRLSEQGAIKLMKRLLISVAGSISTEKDLIKELKRMADHLKAIDKHPEQELVQDQANLIFGRLELDFNVDLTGSVETLQTPAPPSTRPTRTRRRVRYQETSSDEETSPTSVVPATACTVTRRSERASKTAAVAKITANRGRSMEEDDIAKQEDSEVTSDESSDESCQLTE